MTGLLLMICDDDDDDHILYFGSWRGGALYEDKEREHYIHYECSMVPSEWKTSATWPFLHDLAPAIEQDVLIGPGVLWFWLTNAPLTQMLIVRSNLWTESLRLGKSRCKVQWDIAVQKVSQLSTWMRIAESKWIAMLWRSRGKRYLSQKHIPYQPVPWWVFMM